MKWSAATKHKIYNLSIIEFTWKKNTINQTQMIQHYLIEKNKYQSKVTNWISARYPYFWVNIQRVNNIQGHDYEPWHHNPASITQYQYTGSSHDILIQRPFRDITTQQ